MTSTPFTRKLTGYTLKTGDGAAADVTFQGYVLGHATSRHLTHINHPREFARTGERCGACRWTEVTIYRRYLPKARGTTDRPEDVPSGDYDYLVYRVGRSIVPGERVRRTLDDTRSAFEVVEFMVVRPNGGDPYMPPQHSRALAQAAEVDDKIRDAYINRAVI